MNKLKMRPNIYRGTLITFCGLDGSGKTTMLNRVMQDLLNDKDILLTKQPTNSVRDSAIFRTYMDTDNHNSYDYRSLSLLAASDRVQHDFAVITPALEAGKIVISDRYYYSCLANLRARGYTNDKWIYEIANNIVKPDISFFFDVPVEIAVSRVKSRVDERDRYIDMELQYKLREEYIKICKANKGILISTELSEDESYEAVKNAIEKRIF